MSDPTLQSCQVLHRDETLYYVGIGAASAPPEILHIFTKLASRLAKMGLHLRTQAVTDANRAFFKGAHSVSGAASVFVPWLDREQLRNSVFVTPTIEGYKNVQRKTINFHKLHKSQIDIRASAENLIFGTDTESPAKFIVCWSEDGAETFKQISPGTGEIRMALDLKPHWYMPVFNFQRPDAMERLSEFMSSIKKDIEAKEATKVPDPVEINKIIADYEKFGILSITY